MSCWQWPGDSGGVDLVGSTLREYQFPVIDVNPLVEVGAHLQELADFLEAQFFMESASQPPALCVRGQVNGGFRHLVVIYSAQVLGVRCDRIPN